MKRNNYLKPGVIGMYIVFILFSILLIFLFGLGIPILMKTHAEFYSAGKDILESINTTNLPPEMQEAINAGQESISTQTEILGFFFQYGWLIVIIVILFILFMRTRTTVEAEIR